LEGIRDLARRAAALPELSQDSASRGISEGPERASCCHWRQNN
jgi:hypothetical protein